MADKTTPVRCYVEDIPDLTQLRLQLSVFRRRDISTAETIRWLLALDEAQQVIKNAAQHPKRGEQ